MLPPTIKQRKLERVIEQLTAANDGVPPSYGEIAAALKITHAAARDMTRRLIARGRAKMQFGRPRTLELIKEGSAA